MSALRWETVDRFYRVNLQRDLLGDLAVLCVWGSRTSRLGNHKLIACRDLAAARGEIRAIARARRLHGYRFAPKAGLAYQPATAHQPTTPAQIRDADQLGLW